MVVLKNNSENQNFLKIEEHIYIYYYILRGDLREPRTRWRVWPGKASRSPEVTGKSEIWVSLITLLPPRPDSSKARENGRIDLFSTEEVSVNVSTS